MSFRLWQILDRVSNDKIGRADRVLPGTRQVEKYSRNRLVVKREGGAIIRSFGSRGDGPPTRIIHGSIKLSKENPREHLRPDAF